MQTHHQILAAMLASVISTAVGAAPEPWISQLAGDPAWLKLGHYQRERGTVTGWRSTIHPGEFFLSAAGHVDPQAELVATVAAMDAPAPADPDQHAQCRFPARLLWLRRQPGDHARIRTDIACPGFDAWTRSGSVASVSIVLANGFLGNPASYYGHTLLKFNYRDSDSQTRLLDESASYGAIDEGRPDNPLIYIVKSLFHGYDAGFSHIRFYFHDHHYGDEELRDLWEYRLDLSDHDRDMVVAHTWEVLGKRYTYEFFHGNCALRMAEVVELAQGVDIVPRGRPWVVPQALTARLARATYQGRPLVSDIVYHPSRQSRFYQKYRALQPGGRRLLHDLVLGETQLRDPALQLQPPATQQAVLDALLDYHQFVHNPLDKADLAARTSYNEALSLRFQLPAGAPEVATTRPTSPDGAHAPGWVQGAWTHDSALGDMWSLRVRAAYYDTLDFDTSHVRFSSLVMGDVRLDLIDGRVRLNRLDLVRIESVKPGITGLPGDRGTAWKLGVGAEQARLGCRHCLAFRMQGDMGYTRTWRERVLFGAYAGGAVQTGAGEHGWGFGRASATVNVDLGRAWRGRLSYEQRFPVGQSNETYGSGNAELRWSWRNRGDVRVSYNRERVDELGIGVGYYW